MEDGRVRRSDESVEARIQVVVPVQTRSHTCDLGAGRAPLDDSSPANASSRSPGGRVRRLIDVFVTRTTHGHGHNAVQLWQVSALLALSLRSVELLLLESNQFAASGLNGASNSRTSLSSWIVVG
jgi:hypothetical protein